MNMRLLSDISGRLRSIIGPVFGVTLIVYLAYHTIQGERGFLAHRQLTTQVIQANHTHAQLASERAALEHRVKLLHPASLDRDILEERSRFLLGYSYSDELVIFLKH